MGKKGRKDIHISINEEDYLLLDILSKESCVSRSRILLHGLYDIFSLYPMEDKRRMLDKLNERMKDIEQSRV